MRKVMFALAIVAGAFMAVGPASAQCTYRMNDVGRFHGYLGGPGNGAAQGYSEAYLSRRATWYRRDGSVSPDDPSRRRVRTGNTVRVYNGNGQLTMTVIKNGNTARGYDARGSPCAQSSFRSKRNSYIRHAGSVSFVYARHRGKAI